MAPPRVQDELSRTLSQLRKDADLTLAQVADRTGMSVATVSRLLAGKYVPTGEQVDALAAAVGARGAERRRMAQLAEDLRERTTTRQVLIRAGAATQRRFGSIEAAAGHVQTFSPAMVVGLMQTADYARVVFESVLPDSQVDDAVRARLERQEKLAAAKGPAYTQVMSEGALLWQVGSPELMVAQCEHIADAAMLGGRVQVGIIPWQHRARVFPMHSFDLYDERAVIVGTITGTAYLTSPGDVDEYVAMFQALVELAVFGEEARDVLLERAAHYRGTIQ